MLTPYTGPFNEREAYHLLRRCCFGVSRTQVLDAIARGLEATLDLLLTYAPLGPPPLNTDETSDPNVAIGETWITAPYLTDFQVNPYRSRSLNAWQVQLYLEAGTSLTPQLSLFWVNHFGAGRDGDPRIWYSYTRLLERMALGNFRELVKDITIEMQMLRFLNGNKNRGVSPNENYARELLELFTLGKGPLIAPGDYSTYTEQDVREFARAFSGWETRNFESTDVNRQPEVLFQPAYHDQEVKTLSYHFGGQSIQPNGENEYRDVIDIVFAKAGAGKYLVEKLYRWFVDYDITQEIQDNVITLLADFFAQEDFELKPLLRELLGSEHFFDLQHRGAIIKHPFDFVCDLHHSFSFSPRVELDQKYFYYRRMTWLCNSQHMVLNQPPSVAGWKAYYQAPQYHRVWINAATLQERARISSEQIAYGVFYPDGIQDEVSLADLLDDFDDPSNVEPMLEEWALRLLPLPLESTQLVSLKQLLLNGLPDFEWTVEYNNFIQNRQDQGIRFSVEQKLRTLVTALVNSAQFQLK